MVILKPLFAYSSNTTFRWILLKQKTLLSWKISRTKSLRLSSGISLMYFWTITLSLYMHIMFTPFDFIQLQIIIVKSVRDRYNATLWFISYILTSLPQKEIFCLITPNNKVTSLCCQANIFLALFYIFNVFARDKIDFFCGILAFRPNSCNLRLSVNFTFLAPFHFVTYWYFLTSKYSNIQILIA